MPDGEFRFAPSNPLQDAFIWNTARESVFDGGVGNGKSTGGIARLLVLASRYPRSQWVVFRQEFKTLQETTRRTFYKVCPREWIKRDVPLETELLNGAVIFWKHMDAYDEKTLRSLEINGAFGDQIEEIKPEIWEFLGSRIGRWQLPEWGRRCPPYLWGTCNPEGHDWVYYGFHPEIQKYAHVKYLPVSARTREYCEKNFNVQLGPTDGGTIALSPNKAYFFGNTLVNLEKLNEIEPTYVLNLLRKPESWKQKMVYGSRNIFEGMIHRAFNIGVHVYDPKEFDPFKMRQIRHVWGYFDYGLSAPTCLQLVATDNDGFAFFFREYYAANRTISAHSNEIKQIIAELQEKNQRRIEGIYADPSIFFKETRDRNVITTSVADEYAQNGIFMIRADNNEDSSIERLDEFLQVDPGRMNPLTRELGSPKVFFSKDCANVVEQIPQQRWRVVRNVLTGEKEFTGERDDGVPDHAYDPVRYWANSRTDYQPYTGPIRTPHYGRIHAPA